MISFLFGIVFMHHLKKIQDNTNHLHLKYCILSTEFKRDLFHVKDLKFVFDLFLRLHVIISCVRMRKCCTAAACLWRQYMCFVFPPGKEEMSGVTYKQEGLVPFVVDAIYVMAYALEKLLHFRCPGQSRICNRMRVVAGPQLLRYIRNVSFIG